MGHFQKALDEYLEACSSFRKISRHSMIASIISHCLHLNKPRPEQNNTFFTQKIIKKDGHLIIWTTIAAVVNVLR